MGVCISNRGVCISNRGCADRQAAKARVLLLAASWCVCVAGVGQASVVGAQVGELRGGLGLCGAGRGQVISVVQLIVRGGAMRLVFVGSRKVLGGQERAGSIHWLGCCSVSTADRKIRHQIQEQPSEGLVMSLDGQQGSTISASRHPPLLRARTYSCITPAITLATREPHPALTHAHTPVTRSHVSLMPYTLSSPFTRTPMSPGRPRLRRCTAC